MSVPHRPRGDHPPTAVFKQLFTDTWFYMLYFQEPGVADADHGRDPATTMRRFLAAISAEGDMGDLAGARDGRGMVDRMAEPEKLPAWLTQDELDHFVTEFTRTGFTGGLNWYRNLDRNWELTTELAGRKVEPPALFIAGARDPVIVMMPYQRMAESVPDLRGTVISPETGHWVQQEQPAEVNAALLDFLAGLDR